MTYEAVEQAYVASYRRLVGQLYGVCGDLVEAEEVVAEAFARAVAHRRRFEEADNPEAWLRTVAVNLARTRWRRRQVAARLGRLVPVEQPRRSHPEELTHDRMLLVRAMQRLSAGQREALALHYFADLPVHDVARTLGVPPGTVKAHLSRGRAALARILAAPDGPAETVDTLAEGAPRD